MTSNWFDKAAKRAADRSTKSRLDVVNDVAAKLIPGTVERTAFDEFAARSNTLISRRTGIKLALGTALTASVAPFIDVGTAQALFCGKISAGDCLTDRAIISATDAFFEAEVGGQDLEIFGLLDAALVFYEAAETLDNGESGGNGGGDEGGCACDPDEGQICCCNEACFTAPDCDGYCG
jgi:hypothetical protein